MEIKDHHEQREELLLSLSMTCRAMRLRLLSWLWERVECFNLIPSHGPEDFRRGINAVMGTLRMDTFLAASVKCFRAGFWCTSGEADACPLQVHDGIHRV